MAKRDAIEVEGTVIEPLPNTMFAFVKTDNAFHGVEPVRDADARRHLLLYDIRLAKVPEPVAPGTGGSTGVPSSGARFTF